MCSLIGALVLCGANNLLNMYIGIELVSFPLFALIALQDAQPLASESGLKYFIWRNCFRGNAVWFVILIFSCGQGLDFNYLVSALSGFSGLLPQLGLAFVFAGFAFKLALAPTYLVAVCI